MTAPMRLAMALQEAGVAIAAVADLRPEAERCGAGVRPAGTHRYAA